MSSLFFIIIYLLTFILQSSGNFHCINVQGGYTSTGDDVKSSVSCPSSYTMTSCGFYGKSGVHRDGGYIAGSIHEDICYAQNARHGTGVRPIARCCQFPGNIACFDGSAKISGDDNRVAFKCPNGYHIFGCTAYCPWSDFDGSFFSRTIDDIPEDQAKNIDYPEGEAICQVQSSGSETTGHARCCKSTQLYPMTCKHRYGSKGTTSIVFCSEGYTMTGCAAWTYWDGQNRWYIDDNNNCIAQSGNSADVWASASCCKIDYDTTPLARSIGFSRSDDSKLTAITLNATSIFLVLTILVIISLLCCIYYQSKTILAVPTTEIDESTADEIQKLKAYQI